MECDEAQFNCLLQLLSCGYMTTIKTALCQHAGQRETGSGMSTVNQPSSRNQQKHSTLQELPVKESKHSVFLCESVYVYGVWNCKDASEMTIYKNCHITNIYRVDRNAIGWSKSPLYIRKRYKFSLKIINIRKIIILYTWKL